MRVYRFMLYNIFIPAQICDFIHYLCLRQERGASALLRGCTLASNTAKKCTVRRPENAMRRRAFLFSSISAIINLLTVIYHAKKMLLYRLAFCLLPLYT